MVLQPCHSFGHTSGYDPIVTITFLPAPPLRQLSAFGAAGLEWQNSVPLFSMPWSIKKVGSSV